MTTTIRILLWELVWKHRVVFPALALLFALGVVLAWEVVAHGADNPWWLNHARGITLVAFLASLLLGFAPFTLMESSGGWRMNSMTTRWFVLPVRTAVLVLLPLLAAVSFIAAVFGLWVPVLGRALGPGLDSRYFVASLVLGVVFLQAVAWTVPRRPGQYWAVAGVVLPFTLLLALIPQDQPDTGAWRQYAPGRFAMASVVLGAFALYAARRNRCGDWPGHLPFEQLWQRIQEGRPSTRTLRSPRQALFRSDALPALRFLVVSWLVLATAVVGLAMLSMVMRRPDAPVNAEFLVFAAVHLLPFIGMLWLGAWGLNLGCEPGSGFRTLLPAFRGTLPVGADLFASARVKALWVGWLTIWLPLALLALAYLPNIRGAWDYDGIDTIRHTLARRMAVSASLVAGALPVLASGRFEGFPNLLLAGMCAWAGTWLTAGFLDTNAPGFTHWMVAGVLVAAKTGAVAWAFWHGLRARILRAGYAVTIGVGWLAAAGLIVAVLPTGLTAYRWRLLGLVILLPLARLAVCPLAVAANRSR